MKSIYILNSYREIINSYINESKARWGIITELSEACHCQRSHFSRMLSDQVELTLEQAEALCRHFEFDENETDYFLNLVLRDRAGTKELKKRYDNQIQKKRKDFENLSLRLQNPTPVDTVNQSIYYSHWIFSALRILVSIPEYQSESSIGERLGLSLKQVKDYLNQLKEFSLVENDQDRWRISSASMHLPKGSAYLSLHHNNWRQKAVLDSQNQKTDGVHYTVVQSISKKDFEILKHKILNLIEEFNLVAKNSKEEELISFCVDFFKP